jgi:membrane associated rhomboid family serine protease
MSALLPPATRALLLINVAVFLLEPLAPNLIMGQFALWPLGSELFRPWQLLTYAFLHGSLMHIFFNMLALFMFGGPLERYLGQRRFLTFFLVCVLTAALTQLAVQSAGGPQEETIGASGGVFGVLLAFAWYFPRARILVLPVPVPLPAWLVVSVYSLVELFAGVRGWQPDVAHFAHLGGLAGGAACILFWRARRQFGR